MSPLASAVRNEKGVARPLALFVLVSLTGLVLAFLSMAGTEPQVSRNLSDASQARYLADSGIEWAFDQLVLNANWSALLAGPAVAGSNPQAAWLTGANGAATTLPGLTATFGTYTVQIRNDIAANDTQITGQALDTGNNVTDNNNVVIVTATGTLPNGTTRQIQAVVSRIPLAVPGAINLPGVATKVDLPGNMEIYGLDTQPGSTNEGDGSCPPAYGLTVSPGNEASVEASIKATQKAKIKGRLQGSNPPVAGGVGDTTIVEDSNFTSKSVTDFVNALKGKANISLTSTPADPLLYNNNQAGPISTKGQDGTIGLSCATNWNSPTCWGTPSQPKIVYVKASSFNPSSPFNPASLEVSDIQGAGILIVEDGTLFLNGAPGWQGVIIATGQDVGFKICCGQVHQVWGALIVNETSGGDPKVNLEYTGGQHTDIYYSCQAINNALNSRAATRLTSWREL